MKSLSLSQPLLLIIIGTPGAGKTYFARQFSQTFMAPRVSLETVLACLPEELSEKQKQDASLLLVNQQCNELLKTHKTIILDGVGLSRSERMQWRKVAKEHGYDTLLVWVQTDPSTARYRSLNRNGKKVDDSGRSALSEEYFTKRTKQFTAPSPTESHVVISGKHTYASQAKVVLKKLVGPREESMKNQPIINTQSRALAQSVPNTTTRRGYLIR